MNLVKFLYIGSFIFLLLGEFGKYPFGSSLRSVSILDLMTTLTVLTFITWKIITKTSIFIPKYFKYLVIFWGVGIISLIYSFRFLGLSQILFGSLYLFRFIVYSGISIMIFNLLKQKILDYRQIYKIVINIGVAFGVIGVAQLIFVPNFEGGPFYLTDYGFDPHHDRLTSTFLDPNFAGIFFVILLTLSFIYLKHKSNLLIASSIYFLTLIYLTFSRTTLLMLISVGIINFFLIRKYINLRNKIIIIGLALLTFSSLLLLSPRYLERVKGGFLIDQSSKERIYSWQNGWQIFTANPLLGVGFNNLRAIADQENLFKVYSQDGGHSGAGIDSSFLFILATTGIIGGVVYILFWLNILKGFLVKSLEKKLLFGLIVSLILASQFINALFYPPIMLVIFSLIPLSSD